jgi:hypothetical protein
MPLEGRGLLRREGRRDEAGADGDEELQPLGAPDQHRGREPGVFAPQAGRRAGGGEPDLLGRLRDRGQVVQRSLPQQARRTGAHAVAAADQLPAVAVDREEPVEVDPAHPAAVLTACPTRATAPSSTGAGSGMVVDMERLSGLRAA